MNTMSTQFNELYQAPSSTVVELKMKSSILETSTDDYNYHNMDEE